MEDKADKRNTDPKPSPSSISSPSSLPLLHPHKPAPPSRLPTPSNSSLTPPPPLPSPVTTLKSEDSGQRERQMPLPHPASPRSASPPPSSPRRPKQEEGEVAQREQRGAQKPAAATFQGIYSGKSGGIQQTHHLFAKQNCLCDVTNICFFALMFRQISLQGTRTSPSLPHSAHLSPLITSQHLQE